MNKKYAVFTTNLACKFSKTVGTADTKGSNCQERHAYTCDEQTDNCRPYIITCNLTQIDRENKIAGTEEHAEEHAGDSDCFCKSQFSFIKVIVHNFSFE